MICDVCGNEVPEGVECSCCLQYEKKKYFAFSRGMIVLFGISIVLLIGFFILLILGGGYHLWVYWVFVLPFISTNMFKRGMKKINKSNTIFIIICVVLFLIWSMATEFINSMWDYIVAPIPPIRYEYYYNNFIFHGPVYKKYVSDRSLELKIYTYDKKGKLIYEEDRGLKLDFR